VKPFVTGSRLLKSDKALPGRYIVVLDEKAIAAAHVRPLADQLSALHGASVERVYSHALRGFSAKMPEAAALRLSNDPRVRYVEEDAELSISTAQANASWALDRIDQRHQPFDETHYYDFTGTGVNAYVLDTGIRTTHAEFGGRAHHAFSSIQDAQGSNDCNGHGTHVAGILGGATYGVAKGVTLHAVRVLGCGGTGSTSGAIAGVDWVTANHVKPAVANMSLGGPVSQALDDAVTASINAGVFYVVSAGNDSGDACYKSPARAPVAMTVGATNFIDGMAWFSNHGSCVDLFAPGEDVISAWPTTDTSTEVLSGTSMAAPHVAGAAARYLEGHPLATPAQVTAELTGKATPNVVEYLAAETPNLLLYTGCLGSNPTPPQVALTSPLPGSTQNVWPTLTATATDDEEVIRVEFFLDDRWIGSDSTAPYALEQGQYVASNGPAVFTARAYDASCNQAVSAPVDVTFKARGRATFDAVRGAPICTDIINFCDSADLLEGRGSFGPERHQPNTVGGSCADGMEGTYRPSPSVERLTVSRIDATPLAAGKEVLVQAVVHAGTRWDAPEFLDLYVSPEGGSPTWSLIDTLSPFTSGRQELSTRYLLPSGERHILRAVYRVGDGAPSACAPGPLNDHDDLIITVNQEPDSTPPIVELTSPADGATVEGLVIVEAAASDNFGVQRVELYDSGNLAATDYRAPYALSWASRSTHNGHHTLTVRAYDAAGNFTTSAPISVLVTNDHTPPQVSLLSPANGATVEQTLSLEASASDDRGVARVDFHVDGTLIGSKSAAPFIVSWNARTVSNGPHVLSATAHDVAGNASPPSSVSVTVDNDHTPPQTAITSPASGATLRDSVSIHATASDDRQIARVEFYVDGAWIGDVTTPPYSMYWDTEEVLNGSHTLTSKAYDAAGLSATSAHVAVFTNNPGAPRYDPVLKVPRCDIYTNLCDSLQLLRGRGPVGPELNAPNTLDGCLDGSAAGTFHQTESIDRIRVFSLDGKPLAPGKQARISVDLWVYSTYPPYTLDRLDLYYAADASQPVWTYITTLQPGVNGETGVGTEYTLPVGNLQAVRANFRRSGSASPCSPGEVDDHDDLVFLVDSAAPTAAITSPAGGATVSGTVRVLASVSDNHEVETVEFYEGQTRLGGDSSPPYDWDWNTRSGPNGSRTVTVRARDRAGNVSTSEPVTVTAENDLTPPTVSLTAPAPGATVMGVVELSASATDDQGIDRVEYYSGSRRIGLHITAPYSFPWNTVNEPTGPHTLTARAYDRAGNVTTSAPAVVTVVRDTTPPAVSITSPVAGAALTGPVTISATATDETQVTKVEFFVDGALLRSDSSSPYSFDWNTLSVANGSHTLTARATDLYGNVRTSSAVAVTVYNDTTAPTASITAPANGATVRGQWVRVQASATDDTAVSWVELLVDGVTTGSDSSAPYEVYWNSKAVPNGTHTLSIRAHDTRGNAGTSAPITVLVDNDPTPPSVAITSPANGASVEGVVSIQADASDNQGVARVEFFRNGISLGSDSTAPYGISWNSRSVASGSYTLTARAYDAENNGATSAAVTVTVDQPPTVTLTAPSSSALVGGVVSVSATATDDMAVVRVEFLADGALIGSDTSAPHAVSWNTSALASGAHTLTAKAYDSGGRVGTSAELVVHIDSTPPGVALTSPAQGMHLRGTVAVEATASDNQAVARVEFYDGATLIGTDTTSPYSVQWDTVGKEGARTLTAKAYDSFGNVGTSAGVGVVVDNTEPTTTISAPAQSARVRGTVQVTATASDNQALSKVEFYAGDTLLNTDISAPYEASWDTTAMADGSVSLTSRAYDLAGNVSSSAVRSITADNTAPTVAVTSPANGSSVFLTATVQASASDNAGVTQVVFYDGGAMIGTDTTAPYSVSWNVLSVPKGWHTLTAKAYDGAGNLTTSAPISVKVN
jgi:subtilisin family serine protease